MADSTFALTLLDAIRSRVQGPIEVDSGPRPSDLTVSLERTSDLTMAAAVLTGPKAMALATIVATDETGNDGTLKVRYLFEPTSPPDRFVTLLISMDERQPEVPSLTRMIPAANWHEREMCDLFGIVPVGHPEAIIFGILVALGRLESRS